MGKYKEPIPKSFLLLHETERKMVKFYLDNYFSRPNELIACWSSEGKHGHELHVLEYSPDMHKHPFSVISFPKVVGNWAVQISAIAYDFEKIQQYLDHDKLFEITSEAREELVLFIKNLTTF